MARGLWCAALVALFWSCSSDDSHPAGESGGNGNAGGDGNAGEPATGAGQPSSSAGSRNQPDAGAPSSSGGASAEAGMSSTSGGQAAGGAPAEAGASGAPQACYPAGCLNGGSCFPADGCHCTPAFTGPFCELPRFEPLQLPGNAASASGVGLSSDGSVAVGNFGNGQNLVGFRWTHSGGVLAFDALPAQVGSSVTALSADGLVAVGRSGAQNEAVRWPGGKLTPTSLLTAAWESLVPLYVSADGSVIAGTGVLTGGAAGAFRWTQASGPTSLGDFQSTNVYVTGMSSDGSVIIGNAGNGLNTTGYIWSSKAAGNKLGQLSKLNGDDHTNALAVSPDGSLVVGDSIQTGASSRRVRWTSKTTPILLDPADPGTPAWGCGGGPFSTCSGTSTDGSVIYTQRNSIAQIWTAAKGLQALAVLQGKFNCVVSAPPHEPLLAGIAGTCLGPPIAVMWDAQRAVRRLDDVLATFGVTAPEITNSTVSVSRATSANGDTVLGDNFNSTVWIARPLP